MYFQPVPHHEPISQPTHLHPDAGHCHFLSDEDFFTICKLKDLSQSEKRKRRRHMEIVVMLSFINHDLPQLLSPDQIAQLEKLTEPVESIDFSTVEKYFKEKIHKYQEIMGEKMYQLKKQLVRSHYLTEQKNLELDMRFKGLDEIPEYLAVKRILDAWWNDDWETVKSTVPYTVIHVSH